ncbi:MAG: globin domain-containing protein [Sulfurovum sp.]
MNKNTIEIVKSTAPLLKERGEEITKAMYPILFEKYPEVKELFKNSKPHQHKKLASAIYAYASNIDNLEALSGAINVMVSTHVKTNVQPKHYPMVEDALLTAIVNVLGESVATPTVIDAWREAYRFLADVLIKEEQKEYNK